MRFPLVPCEILGATVDFTTAKPIVFVLRDGALTMSSSWLADAISVTATSDTAWSLLRREMLEKLAGTLGEQHPALCRAVTSDEVYSLDALLQPTRAAVRAL